MHRDVTSMIFAYIVQSEISQERSMIMNFYKRSYEPILRYVYTEGIKRRGEISLHNKLSFVASQTFSCGCHWNDVAPYISFEVERFEDIPSFWLIQFPACEKIFKQVHSMFPSL